MFQTTSNLLQNFMEFFSECGSQKLSIWLLGHFLLRLCGLHFYTSLSDFYIYLLYITFRANVLVPSQFIFLTFFTLILSFQIYFIKIISFPIFKKWRAWSIFANKVRVMTCFYSFKSTMQVIVRKQITIMSCFCLLNVNCPSGFKERQ